MMKFMVHPSEAAGVEYNVDIAKVGEAHVGSWEIVHRMMPRRHHKNYGWKSHPQNNRTDIGDEYPYYFCALGIPVDGIGDSPASSLGGRIGDFGGVRCGNVVAGGLDPEQFWVYLMWKPPVSNSIWVPLEYLSWKWAGEAKRTGGAWNMIVPQPTPVMAFNRRVTTNFPKWNENFQKEW